MAYSNIKLKKKLTQLVSVQSAMSLQVKSRTKIAAFHVPALNQVGYRSHCLLTIRRVAMASATSAVSSTRIAGPADNMCFLGDWTPQCHQSQSLLAICAHKNDVNVLVAQSRKSKSWQRWEQCRCRCDVTWLVETFKLDTSIWGAKSTAVGCTSAAGYLLVITLQILPRFSCGFGKKHCEAV